MVLRLVGRTVSKVSFHKATDTMLDGNIHKDHAFTGTDVWSFYFIKKSQRLTFLF